MIFRDLTYREMIRALTHHPDLDETFTIYDSDCNDISYEVSMNDDSVALTILEKEDE
ncbi:hypothetical protein ACYSNR_02040 [Enterococcus sp. LJL128]